MIFTNHKFIYFPLTIILLIWSIASYSQEKGIKPYAENPSYWEFESRPILLIGGSNNNNLFQSDDVSAELDKLKAVGGNYIRCTLSCSEAGDEWPFWRAGLRFNLNKFNPEFWKKLDTFFKLTAERGIVVQLEIWDFHDFIDIWERNPWNPAINNVFTTENTRLKEHYPKSGVVKHDFFFSVPMLNNDELLTRYQKMFVDQLLSISLNYNHILYCITNGIFPQYSSEWGWFWAKYLKGKAAQVGVTIQVTELYQDEDVTQKQHLNAQQHPEIYSFIEASPNSRVVGEKHWERLQKVKEGITGNPRPVNNVKIYGGPLGEWTGGPEHGIQRFWRDIIGGAASARFHQPPEGIGISSRALAHIKSARMLTNEYDFFTSKPDINFSMVQERDPDEAYIAFNSNNDVVVYFPDGGQVMVDFINFAGTYTLKWLNLEGANWFSEREVEGGMDIKLTTPFAGGWIALLKKRR